MSAWLVVIGAILQIVIAIMQCHNAKDADTKALHAKNAKDIADAVSSGDVSNINAVVQRLRR